MVRIISIAALTLTPLGCVTVDGFECAQSAECGVDGQCEPNGFCSFPDPDCGSQRRFGDRAGDSSGLCTDPASTDITFSRRPGADFETGHADTVLKESSASLNFGLDGNLGCQRPMSGSTIVSLFRFDVSAISPGTVVESATLELIISGSTATISAHEVLESWTEGSGRGDPGAANYQMREPGTPWTNEGCGTGACASTPSATGSFPTGPASLALDAALVQRWVDNPSANYGVVVRCMIDNMAFIASQEAGEVQDRPLLTVRVGNSG